MNPNPKNPIPIGDVPDARRSHLFHPERVPVDTEPRLPWEGFEIEDVGTAWHLASLSHAAYHGESEARSAAHALGWEFEARVEREGVRADLLRRNGEVLLCCCGTRPNEIRNLRQDGDATLVPHSSGGRVHRGFARAWTALKTGLADLPTPTIATGHSLGGALAILAAMENSLRGTVVFGCPRVGDHDFSGFVPKETVIRYQVTADLVCRLPPRRLGFADAGRLALLNGSRRWLDPSTGRLNRLRTLGQWRFALKLPCLHPSALWFRELADHAIHGYCRKLAHLQER